MYMAPTKREQEINRQVREFLKQDRKTPYKSPRGRRLPKTYELPLVQEFILKQQKGGFPWGKKAQKTRTPQQTEAAHKARQADNDWSDAGARAYASGYKGDVSADDLGSAGMIHRGGAQQAEQELEQYRERHNEVLEKYDVGRLLNDVMRMHFPRLPGWVIANKFKASLHNELVDMLADGWPADPEYIRPHEFAFQLVSAEFDAVDCVQELELGDDYMTRDYLRHQAP